MQGKKSATLGEYLEHFEIDAPIKAIAAAMLSQAINDYIGGEQMPRHGSPAKMSPEDLANQRSAIEWFKRSGSEECLFSFHGVCETLDLSPDWVMKEISAGRAVIVRRSKTRVL